MDVDKTMKEIIGNGSLAETLKDTDKDLLFFASGVPNSNETRESEFDRERELLLSQDRDKHIVYFSSLCIFFDPDSSYSQHKVEMEDIVKTFDRYTIVRIGNPDWVDNPHQLIPFLKDKIESGEPFEVYDEYRHLLTRDEFLYWIDLIPDRSCEMTLTGERLKVKEIVERLR